MSLLKVESKEGGRERGKEEWRAFDKSGYGGKKEGSKGGKEERQVTKCVVYRRKE